MGHWNTLSLPSKSSLGNIYQDNHNSTMGVVILLPRCSRRWSRCTCCRPSPAQQARRSRRSSPLCRSTIYSTNHPFSKPTVCRYTCRFNFVYVFFHLGQFVLVCCVMINSHRPTRCDKTVFSRRFGQCELGITSSLFSTKLRDRPRRTSPE